MKKILLKNKGQTIVEVSLILPLLVILVGAAVDWGLAFFVSHVVQNAAREATRAAVTQTSITKPPIDATVQAVIPDSPLFSNFRDTSHINLTFPDGTCPNVKVTVTISAPFNFFFLRLFDFAPLTITRSSSMRWERQPFNCS